MRTCAQSSQSRSASTLDKAFEFGLKQSQIHVQSVLRAEKVQVELSLLLRRVLHDVHISGLQSFEIAQVVVLRGEATSLLVSKARYLVDPASSHMLVSKIKPCMSKYKPL